MDSDNTTALSTPMKAIAWLGMSLLAVVVAAYSIAIVIAPEFRSPFAEGLFTERPVAAPIHFLGGGIALITGALQLNRRLRTRFLPVHRWLGRLYVLAVATGGVAALELALHASGGLVATAGFGLLAMFWLGSTLMGYRCIKRSKPTAHRRWMIRSYSLTLAAVTLRLYMPLSAMLGLPIAVAYPAISWLAWIPNLLIAEWFVRSRRSSAIVPQGSPLMEVVRADALGDSAETPP